MPDPSHDFLSDYRASREMAAARQVLEREPAELAGFWGASLAFFLSAWKDSARPESGGPVLVVTATQDEADEIQEELETFGTVPVHPFPAWESLFLPASVPAGEIYRERLAVTLLLDRVRNRDVSGEFFIVAPVQAVLQPVPSEERLRGAKWILKTGDEHSPHEIAKVLESFGLRNVPLVHSRGEYSVRGDIFDLFPYEAEYPLRLEFFGNTLESVRRFRPDTQRSVAGAGSEQAEFFRLRPEDVFRDCFRGGEVLVTDFLGDAGRIFLKEPSLVRERVGKILHNLLGEDAETVSRLLFERFLKIRLASFHGLPVVPGESGLNLGFSSVERFLGGDLDQVLGSLEERLGMGYSVEVYCENSAEATRFREILADHKFDEERRLSTRVGAVRRGFEVVELQHLVLTTRELFNRHAIRRVRKKAVPGRAIQNFLELTEGDYVVHLAHGIGRFLGIESFTKNDVPQEFLAIEFRDRVKIYVPVSKIDLVQKYVGSGDRSPILDKVGGVSWTRKKEEVQSALLDLASDLIDIQALRRERPGFAFPEDSEWQREFEAAFPFEETPDQTEVTEAIKSDMRAPRPMDRLICGDVGYGKTEIAMRGIFKAVDAGKQVAVLVPTTILAQQHFRTFSERMAGFPITVDVLSRFRTARAQRKTVHAAAVGKLDVLVGTHRLLSDDVEFRDLGLVIIDEEQRFGVAHKEKLKKMRSTVDVLTLTATPIPRTLHMSLLGIRDISSLTTPPEGRAAIKTEVCRFEPKHIRDIVIRELNRDGQVYFVHNRVHDIVDLKCRLEKVVPEARIDFAHGQMNERELEDKMLRFFEGEIDMLISTTIIENGLDVPNVNTIFIDEADRYGLADLHQLRGRVGRYKHQAYCYLLLPDHRQMNPDAQKRVQALVEFSELGSGFKIAMRDLEIRGAGNILGSAQSGHIAAVGYEMFCRLLEKAVRSLNNEPQADPVHVEIDLALQAFIPDGYLSSAESAEPKLEIYRRISLCTKEEELAELGKELEDRFGPLPRPVECLLDVQGLRLLVAGAGVEYLGLEEQSLILKGEEAMKEFLADCPRRLVVLDPRTVGVSLVDTAGRRPPSVDDERAFRIALEWFRSGIFPERVPKGGRSAEKAGGISSGGR